MYSGTAVSTHNLLYNMAQEFEDILKLTHFEIRVWNEPSAH